MLIPLFAMAGALCAIPTRLYAQRLAQARGGVYGQSKLLYGKLSAAAFMGMGALGFALICAIAGYTQVVKLIQFLLVFQILLCLSAVDIVVRKIPNELLLALLAVYVIGHTLRGGWSGITANLTGAAIAAVVFTIPARMGLQIGWGDIKYATVIGFCFGLTGLLQVMLVMGILLALYTAYLYISRKGGLLSTAAMGPYLSFGAMATMVFPMFLTIF